MTSIVMCSVLLQHKCSLINKMKHECHMITLFKVLNTSSDYGNVRCHCYGRHDKSKCQPIIAIMKAAICSQHYQLQVCDVKHSYQHFTKLKFFIQVIHLFAFFWNRLWNRNWVFNGKIHTASHLKHWFTFVS